jgi:hypothetical protein
MTTDFRTVALFRKGGRLCLTRRAKRLRLVLRFFLLHCWDARVHSLANLLAHMGTVDVVTGQYRGHLD